MPNHGMIGVTPLLALLLLGVSASPTAAQEQSPVAAAPADAIQGFRTARFGMTRDETREAIGADFPAAPLEEMSNPGQGTRILRARLDRLAPGPGPATVTYIFGATSDRLSHINVVWTVDGEAAPEQRAAIASAAVRLAHYFQASSSATHLTSPARAAGPDSLLMFARVDPAGAAVEVSVTGVAYQVRGEAASPALPTGEATLRVSYIANAANPDVRRAGRRGL